MQAGVRGISGLIVLGDGLVVNHRGEVVVGAGGVVGVGLRLRTCSGEMLGALQGGGGVV